MILMPSLHNYRLSPTVVGERSLLEEVGNLGASQRNKYPISSETRWSAAASNYSICELLIKVRPSELLYRPVLENGIIWIGDVANESKTDITHFLDWYAASCQVGQEIAFTRSVGIVRDGNGNQLHENPLQMELSTN